MGSKREGDVGDELAAKADIGLRHGLLTWLLGSSFQESDHFERRDCARNGDCGVVVMRPVGDDAILPS